MYLKISKGKDWDFGAGIHNHLVEIDEEGVVKRYIDLDDTGRIKGFSPSETDTYGVTDHPPLSMKSDWKDLEIPKEEFEGLWSSANAVK